MEARPETIFRLVGYLDLGHAWQRCEGKDRAHWLPLPGRNAGAVAAAIEALGLKRPLALAAEYQDAQWRELQA